MNRILKYIPLIGFLFAFFTFSCKKEIEYKETGGTLKGLVQIYGGTPWKLIDCSNVTVTVEGSNPLLQAKTNEKGEFTIEGLQTGVYDINFFKDSAFASPRIVSYQFVGGNTPAYLSTVYLDSLSSANISNVGVTLKKQFWDSSPYYSIQVTASCYNTVSNRNTFRYFISDDSNVSFKNYLATGTTYTNTESISAYTSTLNLNNLPWGNKLFLILYPCSNYITNYTDMETGNKIYQVRVNKKSEVVEFVIPKN